MELMELNGPDKYEILAELARRRGFFWPSFEIYGGIGGFIDLGPLGASLKRRLEEKWRDFFVRRQGLLEIATPIIMPAKVFEASGHVQHFKDSMVECTKCKRKYRADHIVQDATGMETEGFDLNQLDVLIREKNIHCVECGGELTSPQYFGTMFTTTIGPYSEAVGYARPEAAQGMFIDFRRVYEIAREKMPLGIAQIGQALRNEISPRQGPVRLREFTIMEFEFFFDPENPKCDRLGEVENEKLRIVPLEFREKGVEEPIEVTVAEALKKGYIKQPWSAYFMALSKQFVSELGIPPEKQRFHEKMQTERAHYSAQTYDHQVQLDRWGWVELAGNAYRTDFDLRGHMQTSKVDLTVFKAYDSPIKRKMKVVVPVSSAIGPEFKEHAGEVAKKILEMDASLIEESFSKHGFLMLNGFNVSPNHVRIEEREANESGKRFIPHVIEPSFGAERLVYAVLEYAYSIVKDRVVMKIPRALVPIQAIVLPLVNKDGLDEKARDLYRNLLQAKFDVEYDESGSIGRRYARADEVGIPVAITVDYQTMQDKTATLRDRDSWEQKRFQISEIIDVLHRYLSTESSFEDL
jgi:glycyl-tRNA synthetase